MTRATVLGLTTLLLLSTVALAPSSLGEQGLEEIITGASPGPGWVAYAFTATGGAVELTASLDGLGEQAQLALYVFDGDGALQWTVISTAWRTGTGVHVQTSVEGLPATEATVYTPPTPGPGGSIQIHIFDLVGEHTAVLYASGSMLGWEHALRAENAVAVDAITSGTDAFLHTSRSFSGGASAFAAGSHAAARADLATSVTEEIEGTLLGSYQAGNVSAGKMWVDGPGGRAECPCTFAEASPQARAGPGTYTFGLLGAGADALTAFIGVSPGDFAPHGRVFLGGADVQFPVEIAN